MYCSDNDFLTKRFTSKRCIGRMLDTHEENLKKVLTIGRKGILVTANVTQRFQGQNTKPLFIKTSKFVTLNQFGTSMCFCSCQNKDEEIRDLKSK